MSEKNLVEYMDVYQDGSLWVLVETGMPESHVRIGIGETLREAYDGLESTPIQCTGPDCGRESGLAWAAGAGWCSDSEDLEDVDDAELYEDEEPAPKFDRDDAINKLDAEECGDDEWRYYAEETSTWYRIDGDDLDALAELMSDDDPSIARDAYSHWCAGGYGVEEA